MPKDDVAQAFYESLTAYTGEKRHKVVRRFFFGCFLAATLLLTVIVWSNYGPQFGLAFICAAFISYWIVERTSGPRRATQQTAPPKPGRSRAPRGRSSRVKG